MAKKIRILIDSLKKEFPDLKVSEWDTDSTAILWSGEGSKIRGLPAFNYYAMDIDPNETIWIMGVHKDLVKWSEKNGLFWEPYDTGTWLAYSI